MRVASDIGGTFTDLAYLDEATGEVGTTKVATMPANYAEGVVETLRKEMAEALLQDKKLAIYEVGYLLGYSEPSAFSRAIAPASSRPTSRSCP